MTSYYARSNRKDNAYILEVFLKNITQSLPNYMFWKDDKSVYLGCNQNFARLIGLRTPEEIIGKTDQDLHWQPAGDTAELFQQGDRATLAGRPVTNQEETLALPNGKKLITLVSKLPILDGNRVLGIVGYFTDITSLKKKERELRQARRQAEAANQAKSVFIANISHDLRTPLTGLLGMAAVLQQEVQTPQGKAAADDLFKSGSTLMNLLNAVIEFSCCASGDLPVHEIKFDLLEVIQSIVTLLKPSVQEKNLEFNMTLGNHLPRYVISDATRLQRILLNLLSNAIKFTHQGVIDFSVQLVRRKHQRAIIEFRVRDTGIGIREDQQAFIFTRFSRLHPAYEGQYPGSGLSLALVKQFVDELAGEIHVDSAEGVGSTFTCLMPLRIPLSFGSEYSHRVASPMPISVDTQNSIIPFKTKLITPAKAFVLIVEDNVIAQRVIKNLWESLGVVVDTADNGAQALQKIQNDDYPLILMDLGLPDQDGYQVTVAIHQWQQQHQHPVSLVAALSAHLGEAERQRCLTVGMISAYVKPLQQKDAEELLRLVNDQSKKNDKGKRYASH